MRKILTQTAFAVLISLLHCLSFSLLAESIELKSDNAAFSEAISHSSTASRDETFTPAPTDGARLSHTTSRPAGSTIYINVSSSEQNIWIDLNADGIYQTGEELPAGEAKEFSVQKQEMTIYGKLTGIDCSNNELSSLDITQMPDLEDLYCFINLLESLDLSQSGKLKTLSCASNKFKSLNLGSCPLLKELSCQENEIKQAEMQALIESLPTPSEKGSFCSVNPDFNGNVCTTS